MRGPEELHPDASARCSPEEPRIPDHLIDAVLDGEASADDRRFLFAALRRDEQSQARLDSTRRAVDALRLASAPEDDAAPPDLTASILGEVDRRKGLFGRGGLRAMSVARAAIAAGLMLAGVGVFVAHRMAPDTVSLTPRVTPISDVVRALPAEPTGAMSSLRTAADSLRAAVAAPAQHAVEARACPEAWRCALQAGFNRAKQAGPSIPDDGAPGWTITHLSPEAVWLESVGRADAGVRGVRGGRRVVYVRAGAGMVLAGSVSAPSGTIRLTPLLSVSAPEPMIADRGVVFAER